MNNTEKEKSLGERIGSIFGQILAITLTVCAWIIGVLFTLKCAWFILFRFLM